MKHLTDIQLRTHIYIGSILTEGMNLHVSPGRQDANMDDSGCIGSRWSFSAVSFRHIYGPTDERLSLTMEIEVDIGEVFEIWVPISEQKHSYV